MIRVTQLISKYKRPFNEIEMSERCAKKAGCTPEELRRRWREKSERACQRGHEIHEMIEAGDYERWPAIAALLENSDIEEIRYEQKMVSSKLALSGTCDTLVRFRSGFASVLDWKTNEKPIVFDHPYGNMFAPLDKVPDCNGSHYALQQALYSILLEEEHQIKVQDAAIVHIAHDDTVTVYKIDLAYWIEQAKKMLVHSNIMRTHYDDVGF